jgi:hypothetical protein
VESIREYLAAYESGFDVSADYTSSKLKYRSGVVKKAKPSMCSTDTSGISSKIAKDDPRKRVPILVELTEDVYNACRCGRGESRKNNILNAIRDVNPTLYDELSRMKKNQISEPRDQSSIRRNIYTIREAIRENRTVATSINEADRSSNLYNIWLDKEKHTLMVERWYGETEDDHDTNERTSLPDA